MHATIPALPEGIQHIIQSGFEDGQRNGKLVGLLDRAEGRILASGMAVVVKLGFSFLNNEAFTSSKAKESQQFFEDNFIIKDPHAPDGHRYYQGQFLIRTRKAEDDMNLWIRFCPNPDTLYIQTPLGRFLNPAAVVYVRPMNEAEAEEIEHDPSRCDLLIRFKDTKAILGLLQRPDTDVVQLLLENLVQITGNFGHMFKFGAIGNNARIMMDRHEP